MSLTVSIDAVLRLDDVVNASGVVLWQAAGYGSLQSARNAVGAGTFPIRRIPGIGAVRFTALEVEAFTQRGEVTNEALLQRRGPKRRLRLVAHR